MEDGETGKERTYARSSSTQSVRKRRGGAPTHGRRRRKKGGEERKGGKELTRVRTDSSPLPGESAYAHAEEGRTQRMRTQEGKGASNVGFALHTQFRPALGIKREFRQVRRSRH